MHFPRLVRSCGFLVALLIGLGQLPAAIGPNVEAYAIPDATAFQPAPPSAEPAAESFSQPDPGYGAPAPASAMRVYVYVHVTAFARAWIYVYVGMEDPINNWDPSGLDYIKHSGTDVYWVVERDDWKNTDVAEYKIGTRTTWQEAGTLWGTNTYYGSTVSILPEFGGGTVDGGALETYASRLWNRHGDISGFNHQGMIRWFIRNLQGGSRIGYWEGSTTAAVTSGAAEGLQGGASITANTFTFGGSDYIGLTDSNQYQGGAYTASRVLSTVSREALITAATLGTAQIARGGVEGSRALTYSGQVVNYAAQSQRAVQTARVAATALVVRDAAQGGWNVGTGINKVAIEGDPWGYLDIGLGGLQLFGGFAGARELSTSRNALINELVEGGIKHSADDILKIARRNSDDAVVFLENGNSRAGLQHIIQAHADDFANIGIPQSQIADAVIEAASRGTRVGMQGARPIYEFGFGGRRLRLAVTVGDNGFIVGANPVGR